MSNHLIVPIHLDALHLTKPQLVVGPLVDFSVLPYVDYENKQDVHSDTAYVSKNMVSQPFSDRYLTLQPGIHLHWALPDGLTKALTKAVHPKQPNGQEDQTQVEFPPVPDRWLISRSGGGQPEKQWIVESDYLSTDFQSGGIPFPLPADAAAKLRPGERRFRYLGRSYPVDQPPTQRGGDIYLNQSSPKLTAVGYGEPTFAAFYPNCHSVFGFWDDAFSAESVPENLCYEVIGWYANPEHDPFRSLVTQLAEGDKTSNSLSLKKALDAALDAIKQRFDWKVTAEQIKQITDLPQQIACYARLKFSREKPPGNPSDPAQVEVTVANNPTEAKKPKSPFDPAQVEVTVANNPTEALSAYIAHHLSEVCKPKVYEPKQVENQLEAVYLASTLAHHRLDLGAKFEEARHSKTFAPVSAGTLWTVQRRPDPIKAAQAKTASPQQAIQLPSEIAHLLNDLNQLQLAYDKGCAEIVSRRQQIYADWYKYMLFCYQPPANRPPHVDQAKGYLEQEIAELDQVIGFVKGREALLAQKQAYGVQQSLPSLREMLPDPILVELGDRIFPPSCKWSKWYSTNQTEPLLSIKEWLSKNCDDLEKALKDIPDVELHPTPAPQYWQPTEPVVLLVGEGVQPSDRHGQDGILNCPVVNITINKIPDLDSIEAIHQQFRTDQSSDIGARITDGSPWHPLFLEWEVALFPLLGQPQGTDEDQDITAHSNIPADSREYDPNFIAGNFELKETHMAFLRLRESSILTNSNSTFSGRSILTPNAQKQSLSAIEEYLSHEVDDYLNNNPTAEGLEKGTQLDYLENHWKEILEWCDRDYQKGLMQAYLQTPVLTRDEGQESSVEKMRQDLLKSSESKDYPTFFDSHKTAILDWFAEISDSTQDQAPIHTVIDSWNILKTLNAQSQSLSGFNAALLMHQQTLQLDIADPLGFDDYRTFTETEVRPAIADQNRVAPQPHLDFHPIRTGEMSVNQLQIVDTFGRPVGLSCENVKTTEQLAANKTTEQIGNNVLLPPRIMQPARINFRWLSANDGEIEVSAHADTSPICGWVLTNNLDNSLMIYDSDGIASGYLDQTGTWRSPPGRTGLESPDNIPNPYLAQLVKYFCRLAQEATDPAKFMAALIDVIDSALENIDPENFAQHESQALLVGRPLALVRAMVNLELLGSPSQHQGLTTFCHRIAGNPPKTDRFEEVKFPIRIGEHMQFNDGVVCYWLETAAGYEEDKLYAPQSQWWKETNVQDKHLVIYHDPKASLNFQQAISDSPHIVSMLVDPRGSVHCTSGVLPTKVLSIPKEHYADALQRINVTFLSAPLLTNQGQINIPLPQEPGCIWSWLQRDRAEWTEIKTIPIIHKQVFSDTSTYGDDVWNRLIERGWLQSADNNRAIVLPLSDRKPLAVV